MYSIVHSLDGYDEVSLTDSCKIVTNSGEQLYTPEDMGFRTIAQRDLWGGDTIAEAAQIFINILDNKGTDAQTNAVVINAAIAIQTRCPEKDLEQCKAEAIQSLQSGKAKQAFVKFEEVYR
jgi:anthranilate phosphoribosyltransferase